MGRWRSPAGASAKMNSLVNLPVCIPHSVPKWMLLHILACHLSLRSVLAVANLEQDKIPLCTFAPSNAIKALGSINYFDDTEPSLDTDFYHRAQIPRLGHLC